MGNQTDRDIEGQAFIITYHGVTQFKKRGLPYTRLAGLRGPG